MKILVTGAGGLVGSAVSLLASSLGHSVVGFDSDARGRWFGSSGSVDWRLDELKSRGVKVVRSDFRLVENVDHFDAIVHCASQPSHDFSRDHVIEDSSVNYMGTVVLLESARKSKHNPVFVFISTNKVYGDRINSLKFFSNGLRFTPSVEVEGVSSVFGVNEKFNIDASLHTPFGVSKLAADLMVQEYRRCFGLKSVCFRCGCITGAGGSAVELHGFLGYLVKVAVSGGTYRIYGHGGLQVRDNISADDLASAILLYIDNPIGDVYNMGGGPENSVSILETMKYLRSKGLRFSVVNEPPRLGDHKWWITDTAKFERDYPAWKKQKSVWRVIDEMVECELSRRRSEGRHETLSSSAV
jgi:CDP-paratose 2-epimerase